MSGIIFLHVSVLCSFLLIPYFDDHLPVDYLGYFQFLVLMRNAAVNTCGHVVWACLHFCQISRVEFLGHIVSYV